IYHMIVSRYLMLYLHEYKEKVEKIKLSFGSARFVASNKKVLEPGWKGTSDEPKAKVVHYTEGQKIKGEFSIEKQLTTPPKPLSEGTLLAKMEKYSLGTPATRA